MAGFVCEFSVSSWSLETADPRCYLPFPPNTTAQHPPAHNTHPHRPHAHLSSLMTGPISSSFLAGSVPFLNTSRRPSTSSGPIPVRAEMLSHVSSPAAGAAAPAAPAPAAGLLVAPEAAERLASGTDSRAAPRRLPARVFCCEGEGMVRWRVCE